MRQPLLPARVTERELRQSEEAPANGEDTDHRREQEDPHPSRGGRLQVQAHHLQEGQVARGADREPERDGQEGDAGAGGRLHQAHGRSREEARQGRRVHEQGAPRDDRVRPNLRRQELQELGARAAIRTDRQGRPEGGARARVSGQARRPSLQAPREEPGDRQVQEVVQEGDEGSDEETHADDGRSKTASGDN